MASKRFRLNKADIAYVIERGKLFLLPLVLLYVGTIIPKITSDGFQVSDFGLNDFELGALVLYVLNRIQTLGQLFIAGKK